MGRGRAKAKQTKVARELKYRSYETDLDALQRELAGRDDTGNGKASSELDADVDEPDEDDERIARGYQAS
jgi:Protein of unknown function (DUF3073)